MNPTPSAVFVPWLHMHQPPIWVGEGDNSRLIGNLEKMLNGPENSEERWNAQLFAKAYKNPAYYVEQLCNEGHAPRIMLDYSGVLLDELAKLAADGTLDRLNVHGETIGDIIGLLRRILAEHPETIEFAGTSYSHCYFPATPERDWEAQIVEWRRIFANLFGEEALSRVRGFWLPEMGMMGDPAKALRFMRLLKQCGYQWLILPHAAMERPEGWSVPALENQVHWLVVEAGGESERILCVVRDTDMGIRQQSGQNADGCINDIRYRARVLQEAGITQPPLIVPTSDGENGNVMMFEYFPNSFAPLFRNSQAWQDVAFLTVSEYIDRYLPQGATTEVRLNTTGGSWIGGHTSWNEGTERQKILGLVEQLSRDVAQVREENRLSPEAMAQLEKALLLCETSCYVYWGTQFWFDQGERCVRWVRERLQSLAGVGV